MNNQARFSMLLLFLVSGFILTVLIYKYIFAEDLPAAFVNQIKNQLNPFSVPKDSAQVVWARAKQYLADRRWLINGNPIRETDSTIIVPYYNKAKKGVSIKIESTKIGDSVVFTTYFWAFQNLKEQASKEMALYLNKGITRYNFRRGASR